MSTCKPSSVSEKESGTVCGIVSEKGDESSSPVTTGQPKLSVSVKRKEKPSSKPGASGTGTQKRDTGLDADTSSSLQRSVGGNVGSRNGSALTSVEPSVLSEEIEMASATEYPSSRSRVRGTKASSSKSRSPASRVREAALQWRW